VRDEFDANLAGVAGYMFHALPESLPRGLQFSLLQRFVATSGPFTAISSELRDQLGLKTRRVRRKPRKIHRLSGLRCTIARVAAQDAELCDPSFRPCGTRYRRHTNAAKGKHANVIAFERLLERGIALAKSIDARRRAAA
jgi:hypothetical protein